MDPITGGLAIIGLGMQLFGGVSGANNASYAHQVQQQVAGQETALNDQKHDLMLIQNRRQQMENIRNTQRARSLGLNAAVTQGAQFGSGLQGGQAQAQSQGNLNALGMDQSLMAGENTYQINKNITNLRSTLSDVQSSQATDQGIMSLGSSIMGAAGTAGKLSQGVGGSNPFSVFGGGTLSGGFGNT